MTLPRGSSSFFRGGRAHQADRDVLPRRSRRRGKQRNVLPTWLKTNRFETSGGMSGAKRSARAAAGRRARPGARRMPGRARLRAPVPQRRKDDVFACHPYHLGQPARFSKFNFRAEATSGHVLTGPPAPMRSSEKCAPVGSRSGPARSRARGREFLGEARRASDSRGGGRHGRRDAAFSGCVCFLRRTRRRRSIISRFVHRRSGTRAGASARRPRSVLWQPILPALPGRATALSATQISS